MMYPNNYPQSYLPGYQQTYQQPNQTQNQQSGFVPVPSEAVARNYPVAYGQSVSFKDENSPYIYIKAMSFSQMEAPKFEKYKKVDDDPVPVANEISGSEDLKAIKTELEKLKKEIFKLKKELKANDKDEPTEAAVLSEVDKDE